MPGALVGVPLLLGFCVSRLLAEPVFEFVQGHNSEAFALTDKQKVRVCSSFVCTAVSQSANTWSQVPLLNFLLALSLI